MQAVEDLALLADKNGMSLTHMSLAFVLSHPAITSALIGPRTPEQLDDLLAGMKVTLNDEILDEIDKIAPAGVDIAPLEQSAYVPPSLTDIRLRRRPVSERVVL
jgi:aryl-alcohol dehydrogenase (NADP+)